MMTSLRTQDPGQPDHYGTSLAQRRVDAIQERARKELARQKLFRPAPPAPPPSEPQALSASLDPLDSVLAQELDYVRRQLDRLGETLAEDPLVLNRHAGALQSFDVIGQILGNLAKVVGSQDKDEAIARVGMQELRTRLARKSAL
jgi:hypothetical protein